MTAEVLKISTPLRLRCSGCGATQEAACDCGVAYMPAGELAAKAVAENPSISSRALAAQLGVNRSTIDRTRERGGANAPSDGVVGRDGKLYSEKVKPRREGPDIPPPRIEERRATSPLPDFLDPALADTCVKRIAESIRICGLMEPPPGMAACMVEAITRAAPADIATIKEAAELLRKMVERLE